MALTRHTVTIRSKRFCLLALLPAVAGAAQCGTGDAACQCVDAFHGFNVSNAEGAGLVVDLSGVSYNYGVSYGLHGCSAHDRGTPPYCNVPGAPSWCALPWCYVNASACALANAPSSYLADAIGLHYSYETCDSEDTFTAAYTQRAGVLRLCSVFAEDGASGAPCGETATHRQIERMVRALNSLNDGKGFAMESGLLLRHYTFNYSYATYPAGRWDAVGRSLSEQTFNGACDIVVGMGSGCPDSDITAQALVANATRRMYVTARGPQALLTAGGEHQPYLFSARVRSDVYADASLLHFSRLGATSLALLYDNDESEVFYRDLGERVAAYATELQLALVYNATLRRETVTGAADLATLEERLLAAHAARADVLVLVLRAPEFRHALSLLKAKRPPAGGGHVYSALWWQGVPWGGFDCAGLGAECEHALGAAQMSSEEAASGYTDALLGMTHAQMLRAVSGGVGEVGSDNASAAAGLPDAASIPSMIAQALNTIFRFREVTRPALPLADTFDYELLRSYLRSGETVAHTFYGPMRFNALGQNEGKPPTTMQVRNGRARGVLPVERQAEGSVFTYPAPATSCPSDARRLRYDVTADCLLCAPSSCVETSTADALLLGVLLGAALALLAVLLGAALFCHRSRARLLLLRTTGKPPRLRMPSGCSYHLFLSHTWASGQDQCHRIKQGLRACLPSARVFLDVDDLADISALERYVEATVVTLAFLSRGYFQSINCLRELRAWEQASISAAEVTGPSRLSCVAYLPSVERPGQRVKRASERACRNVPSRATGPIQANNCAGGFPRGLLLIRETAQNHGGIPLEVLRAECPADLEPEVFCQRNLRFLVPFYRHERIWAQGLKQIAAFIVGFSAFGDESLRELSRSAKTFKRLQGSIRAPTLSRGSISRGARPTSTSRRKVELPELYFMSEPGYRGVDCMRTLESPTVLAVSPYNPGAAALAAELKASVQNLEILEMPNVPDADGNDAHGDHATEAALAQSTHLLLLLNRHSFMGEDGERLARVLRSALRLPQVRTDDDAAPLPLPPARLLRRRSSHTLFANALPAPLVRQRSSGVALSHRLSAGYREGAQATTMEGNFFAGAIESAFHRAGEGVTDLIHHIGREGSSRVDTKPKNLLLVHAIDMADAGCNFDDFFAVAPPDLVQIGQIFRRPAVPLFHARLFRRISLALAAEALGPLERVTHHHLIEMVAHLDRHSEQSSRSRSSTRRVSIDERPSLMSRISSFAGPPQPRRSQLPPTPEVLEWGQASADHESLTEVSVSVTYRRGRENPHSEMWRQASGRMLHNAAVLVQKIFRGNAVRRVYGISKLLKAAVTVQRMARGSRVRHAVAHATGAVRARELAPVAPSDAPSSNAPLEVVASYVLTIDATAAGAGSSPPSGAGSEQPSMTSQASVVASPPNAAALARARVRSPPPKLPVSAARAHADRAAASPAPRDATTGQAAEGGVEEYEPVLRV